MPNYSPEYRARLEKIGRTIRTARTEQGKLAKWVAEQADIHYNVYQRIEAGTMRTTPETLRLICRALNIQSAPLVLLLLDPDNEPLLTIDEVLSHPTLTDRFLAHPYAASDVRTWAADTLRSIRTALRKRPKSSQDDRDTDESRAIDEP